MQSSVVWKNKQRWILFVAIIVMGCSEATSTSRPSVDRMVYVDTVTMLPMVHDVVASFPAIHPRTGRPTLRPALYCSACKKWYPAPDIDQINRIPGAGLCRKDNTSLTADGPWPDETK